MDIALFRAEITQHIVACYGFSVPDMVVSAQYNVVFAEETREILIALDIFAHTVGQHKQRLGLFGNIKIKMNVAQPRAAWESTRDLFHNNSPY